MAATSIKSRVSLWYQTSTSAPNDNIWLKSTGESQALWNASVSFDDKVTLWQTYKGWRCSLIYTPNQLQLTAIDPHRLMTAQSTGTVGCELLVKILDNRPRLTMEGFGIQSPWPASERFPLFVCGRDFTNITLHFADISKIPNWDAKQIIRLITGTTEDVRADEILDLVAINSKANQPSGRQT
ncbi:hypothetical protein H2200_010002 [Cladophialophora chaetospira]|uniref:Uncharacterized protein n=1 Tax=Cladophialophora chaetospira TaxID=386627 RepID=A0AA39CED3_9EURO|nr:hypothetical protein H2200_010002 [Cladophialophora chaetospira]